MSAKRALIVVDMQKDFFPGGALPVPGAQDILPVVNNYISHFMDNNDLIVYSQDFHPEESSHFDEFPQHCVAGTRGAEFVGGLLYPVNYSPTILVRKGMTENDPGFSALSPTAAATLFDKDTVTTSKCMFQLFEDLDIHFVTIVGLALDYCVFSTVFDALAYGFSVLVPLDATSAVDPLQGEAVILSMKNYGVFFGTNMLDKHNMAVL